MKFAHSRARFKTVSKDPGVFVASCALLRAAKLAGLLRFGFRGFLVFVVPRGYNTSDYETAAFDIMNVKRDDESWTEGWVNREIRVRLANPPRIKGTPHKPVSIYNLKGLDILIAQDIEEVPRDVRFAATAVLQVEPPTPGHINAARRLWKKTPFSEEFAASLARHPHNVILAAVLKPLTAESRIRDLDDIDRIETSGPNLFDLPGYSEVKPWAKDLSMDVERWRRKALDWKLARSGVLISGPPGTGKTLFGSALATALGMRLVSATIGEWQSAGALDDMLSAMRNTFASVNDGRGAVLFIDEFDAIGTRLTRPSGHHGDQYWQVVIDDFLALVSNLGDGVIFVAATNYPRWIDPAILRAGRIDNHFTLSLPDTVTRAEILRHHAGDTLSVESLMDLADELDGRSGAELDRLVRDAYRAARNEDRELELRDLEAQLPSMLDYTAEQQLRFAVHEVGHAVASLALKHSISATIEIRRRFDPEKDGSFGGRTIYDLVPDHVPTETSLLTRIAISLSGMAAEQAVFGDRSLGSGGRTGSDIEFATGLARKLVGAYGLGGTPVYIGAADDIGDKPLPQPLEDEALQILRDQYVGALSMMTAERERILAVASDVMAHGSVRIERSGEANAA
ncbi:AAA family ATPase [Rhizobium ruizarguesonis]|uniref:AAA family ATPase n=1 Tax=Rhizobium ruizarguesonis TaxID=2081791 RepID=UPI00102F40EA|nr:AAA family ATPase [Rhizobium ruizarguesonis]TAT84828.1 AAA family ATPase [Rhizobium ruizarguesonis]